MQWLGSALLGCALPSSQSVHGWHYCSDHGCATHHETAQNTGGELRLGPREDKSISIVKGVLSDSTFIIRDDPLPTVSGLPVKSFGSGMVQVWKTKTNRRRRSAAARGREQHPAAGKTEGLVLAGWPEFHSALPPHQSHVPTEYKCPKARLWTTLNGSQCSSD